MYIFHNGKPTAITTNSPKNGPSNGISMAEAQEIKVKREEQETERENNLAYLRGLVAKSRNLNLEDLLGELPLASCPRVWIVGGGPSLLGFDFSLLDGEVVFAVNRSFESVPNPSCVVTMDSRFIDWADNGHLGNAAHEKWLNLKCPKVCVFLKNSPGTYDESHPVYVVERDENGHPSQGRPSMVKLHDCNSSGLAALQLAWAMGAKDIRLLGFDMGTEASPDHEKDISQRDRRPRQAWHHAGYPKVQSSDVYGKMAPMFEPFAEAMAKEDVKVTLYGTSTLECFEKKPIEDAVEALGTKPTRPIVVGYYTEGTAYKDEALEMEKTATFFGLKTDVRPICNYGSWQLNTYAKAEFLRNMLNELDEPILYLDADARVRRYPRFFDDFGKSFGYCTFEWSKVKGSKRKDNETSSAVLYLAPAVIVKQLLSTWADA